MGYNTGDAVNIIALILFFVCICFMFANGWVLYKNPKLLQNWNSIATYVFTVLLLLVRCIVLFGFFHGQTIDYSVYGSFETVECATYLLTCVSFSLLVQWYEVYHLLMEAAGMETKKDAKHFKNLWYRILAVCTFFYVSETVCVLFLVFGQGYSYWKVIKIICCSL